MDFSSDIYRARGVGVEPQKNLASLQVAEAFWSEEGFAPALGTVEREGKCRVPGGESAMGPWGEALMSNRNFP